MNSGSRGDADEPKPAFRHHVVTGTYRVYMCAAHGRSSPPSVVVYDGCVTAAKTLTAR